MYCGSRLTTSHDISPNDQTADVMTRSHLPAIESIADDLDDDSSPGETPPRKIGGYALLRILGAGGQGSVYEAEQSDSGQRVAVKLLSSKFAGSAVSIERFRQEGRLASQIAHPRCVFVYGADTDSGVPFIVMELMPGTTLKDLVDRRGPLPVGEAIARMLDVIDGLIEAHRLGVIHRDVKPSNCFITADDRVKVGDFGLSKSLVGSNPGRQLTTSGKFVGTVLFAPPEQIRGEEVGYDSDVYSVAATMYYLLTAKAPHQHDSLTAALAKAISEPPPPIRKTRPDVPKELERAVLRGLERDRGRRWQSLEEFRDALLEQLPSRHTPARPRAVAAAYLIDSLIFLLVIQIPYEIIRDLIFPSDVIQVTLRDIFDPMYWLMSIFYFGLFEGFLGWTPGKWLVRLRVIKLGETGPPGFVTALKRTAVFHAIWFGMLVLPFLLPVLAGPYGPAPFFLAVIVAIGLFVTGIVILLTQVRKKWGFRGVHDLATGCRVVQRPQRVLRRRLTSRFPNPLERFVKPDADLPESVAGFAVRGQICTTPDGGLVWLAEDRSLARRVLLWLRPTDCPHAAPAAVVRPTRLRQVGDGCLEWNGKTYEWTGSVAPAGSPLADTVDPTKPISWADARPILEQLTDELITAESDGTLPQWLGADQLWVEPAGRLHLLDYPLASGSGIVTQSPTPLDLIRETAALTMQGRPWNGKDSLTAPLPPHAASITDKLTHRNSPYRNLATLQKDLAESHVHPARVTAGVRATHVGIQGMFLFLPHLFLFLVFFVTSFSFLQQAPLAFQARASEYLVEQLDDPKVMTEAVTKVMAREALLPAHRDATIEEMKQHAESLKAASAKGMDETLTALERSLLNRFADLTMSQFDERDMSFQIAEELKESHKRVIKGRTQSEPEAISPLRIKGLSGLILFLTGLFLANRVISAFVFRGGLSWLLTGVTLVQADGRPCSRLRCVMRALVVWLPVLAFCLFLWFVQTQWPHWVAIRVMLTIMLALLLIGYVAVAIRYPSQPPQDRLLGTHIVPM
jgi:serine/threonine protein kinase